MEDTSANAMRQFFRCNRAIFPQQKNMASDIADIH
jgi:hypothetical protein